MRKLIWLGPIIIVSVRIVLINEAAAVATVPLCSFVATEHQNRWHCSGSAACLLKIVKICLIIITLPSASVGVIYPNVPNCS